MAGNYPDAPSWRMAIDRDGTQGYLITPANVVTQLTAENLITLNDEADGSVTVSSAVGALGTLMLIFPELRDIDGYHVNAATTNGAINYVVEVSANTTNGIDGTWTQIGSGSQTENPVVPGFRSVSASTQLAMRAIRFRLTSASGTGSGRLRAFHVYGEPAPDENPDRLALWHPTLDERVTPAYFDWGNVPRSSSGDRLFRVKNLSPTLTALSVRVAMEALTDGSPSVPGQHSLSYGGGSFLAQVNVGDIAPGAISGPVTLRRITPSNAQLGLWAFRVFAEATSWS